MGRSELDFLEHIALFTEAKTIVEVGVQRGEMAVHLCRAAQANNGQYFGFDMWSTHGINNQFVQVGSKEQVTQLLKSNNLNCFTLTPINTIDNREQFKNILKQQCPNGIDFAFIDACHSYLGILNDFKCIYPLMNLKGVVVFHDTCKIDGCREFMIDLRTKYNDGTFDIIDLPYGTGGRNCGVSLLFKRTFPVLDEQIDEICGSISTPKDIEQKELDWYNAQLKNIQIPDITAKDLLRDNITERIERKKYE